MQLKTAYSFKEFFAKQSSSLKLYTNKKYLKYYTRNCISLDCEHKVSFSETSISFKWMRIRTNQTHHDKVQDLFSPMIPIFRLSLKNSQKYTMAKKVQKGSAFFLSPTVSQQPAELRQF